MVSKDEIAEIKRAVNITDIIGQYVALKRNGKNYLGLCPFHSEKTPSFSVNAEKGFYHCFGCGRSGDAIRFLQDYKDMDFQTALKEVADRAGIAVAFDRQAAADNPNAPLYALNNQASRIYQTVLSATEIGQQARLYLASRGMGEDVMKRFEIGLAPDEKDFLYQNLRQKFEEKALADSGLFRFGASQAYDTFQNRLMFPITNQYGQTVGFSGRRWAAGDERQGKYVNTEQTAIFDKSFELYNLHRAKSAIAKSHEIYLMEGFMDVIAAVEAGVSNVAATMGTALTGKHVVRLRKLARKIILCYDGDSAGQAATQKALSLLDGLDVAIVKLPDGLDPDEFAKKNGGEALRQLMAGGRLSRSEFLMDALRPANLATVEAQLGFLQTLTPVIAGETSIQAQDIYIRRLTEMLPDFAYEQVEEAVNAQRENVRATAMSPQLTGVAPPSVSGLTGLQPPVRALTGPVARQTQPLSQLTALQNMSVSRRTELQLLSRLITHPELIEQLSTDASVRFQGRDTAALYDKLIIEQMTTGTIDALSFPESLSADERTLFYSALELNLPSDVTERELTDLLSAIKKETLKSQLAQLAKKNEDARRAGDSTKELELTLQTVKLRQQLQGGNSGN